MDISFRVFFSVLETQTKHLVILLVLIHNIFNAVALDFLVEIEAGCVENI